MTSTSNIENEHNLKGLSKYFNSVTLSGRANVSHVKQNCSNITN